MEQKVFDVDNLINEIYNEFSWVFADNKKYIKLVNIIQKNINELQEENNRLKTELAEKDKRIAELDAIVPKFNCRDKVYFIEDDEYYRIEVGKVMHNNKYVISKDIFPYIDYRNECELFTTKSEAEEALKKLEEK